MTSCPLPPTSRPAGASQPGRDEQAKALCLRLLTARARTRAELADQLAKRGYPDEVSERVLNRLTTAGLIDDADFAEQWVRSRHQYAGKGRKVLAAELRTKGVADEVIADALADLDTDAERDRAEQLVRAKLRRETLGGDPGGAAGDVRVTRRLVAMLARRGYSPSLAHEVVSGALAAERERRRV